MSFSVAWTAEAEEQLADVWMKAARPREVNDAINELEFRLAIDPSAVGESRSGRTRLAFSGPIAILFRVNEKRQTVRIISVALK